MDYLNKYKFDTEVSFLFQTKIKKTLTKKRVLDLGCGSGEYLKYFGQNSLGLDLSPNNLENAKSKGLNVRQFDFNNTQELPEKYEAVFCSHVLEHLENPISFLRFINRQLTTTGTLVLSVPNEISLINLFYPYFTSDGNHLYSFSVNNLKELLVSTGFEINEIYYDYYTSLTRKLKIDNYLYLLDTLPKVVKTPLAWAFWIVATKKS